MVRQSSELIRFISGVPVSSDGTVPLNNLEDSNDFESDLYSPTYSLSVLARMTLNVLNSGKIELTSDPIEPGTITELILDSDLSSYAPNIYMLTRIVVLESFSLVYSINEQRENLQYITGGDIHRIKCNIHYLADYMSTEDKYYKMIDILRHMFISLGYIEHQIDVIMNNQGQER